MGTIRSRVSIRVTARLLVALYLLASCRALVPGLCATQAAINAAEEARSQASVQTARACCTMNLSPARNGGQPDTPAKAPSSPHCAFCELVKGHVTPAPVLTLDVSLKAIHPYIARTTARHVPQRLWKRCLARDPPSSELA